ncbi:MAG: hypothetical protein HQL31_11520, partial [Planctomycetes bacterium]|nr:hypothetical protein [Planctomycetota bacterium]
MQVRFRHPDEAASPLFGTENLPWASRPPVKGSLDFQSESFDAATGRHLQTFAWGTVERVWKVGAARLDCTLTVTNRSTDTRWDLRLPLLSLSLNPEARLAPITEATFFGQSSGARTVNSLSEPLVTVMLLGKRCLVACASSNGKPLQLLWRAPVNKKTKTPAAHGDAVAQALADKAKGDDAASANDRVWTLDLQSGGERVVWHERANSRPVPPGGKDSFLVSLRFGQATEPLAPVQDILAAYAKEHPLLCSWPDRRPILPTFIGDWFPLRQPSGPDPVKPAGVEVAAEFKTKVMASADRLIKDALAIDAQGMLLWNLESNGGGLKYVGSPDMMQYLCPEMDAIADEYFKKFRDAGLATGVCLRPTTIVINPAKDKEGKPVEGKWVWGHRYERGKEVETLVREAHYANTRWGTTLFYVDTNDVYMWPKDDAERATWPKTTEGKVKGYHALMNAEQWNEIQRRCPGMLFSVEHTYVQSDASGAPYDQLNMGNIAGAGLTPPVVRAIWPEAFKCLTADYPLGKYLGKTIGVFRNRDVLMYNAPVDAETIDALRQARTLGEWQRQETPTKLRELSAAQLTKRACDPEAAPSERYLAARLLADQAGLVLSLADLEALLASTDFGVQWEALRCVRDPSHLPVAGRIALLNATQPVFTSQAEMALRTLGIPAITPLAVLVRQEDPA